MANENTAKKSSSKTTVIALVVLIVLAAIAGGIYFMTKGDENTNLKTINVDIVLTDGTKTSHEIKTEKGNLYDALIEKGLLLEADAPGGMINKINSVSADSAKEEWWKIQKSGVSLLVGAKDQLIADGDKYEFVLTAGYDNF